MVFGCTPSSAAACATLRRVSLSGSALDPILPPDCPPRSLSANGAFGRARASDGRNGKSRAQPLDGPVRPRTVRGTAGGSGDDGVEHGTDDADRHEQDPEPEADDPGCRGPSVSP